MEYQERVELHCHTKMSAWDSVVDSGELVQKALHEGHRAVAVTDHGTVQAFPEMQEAVKKYGDGDFKIIYGMEAYVFDDTASSAEVTWQMQKDIPYHMTLLVQNEVGKRNLYELVTLAHIRQSEEGLRYPLSSMSEILRLREGILIGSGCKMGQLYRAIMEGKDEEELARIVSFCDFLEVQPAELNQFYIDNPAWQTDSLEEPREINRKIIALGERYKKMAAATGDVHFLEPRDLEYRLSLTVRRHSRMHRLDKSPLYFRSTGEMLREFQYLGEEKAWEIVVENTNRIVDSCERIEPVPEKRYRLEIPDADVILRGMCESRCREEYGETIPGFVTERLEQELKLINNHGHASRYLLAARMASRCREEGYTIRFHSCVGASLVAYLLGIVDFSPLKAHYICKKCHTVAMPEEEFAEEICMYLPKRICPKCGCAMIREGYHIPYQLILGADGSKSPAFSLTVASERLDTVKAVLEEVAGKNHVFACGFVQKISAGKIGQVIAVDYLTAVNEDDSWDRVREIAVHIHGVKSCVGSIGYGYMAFPKEQDIFELTPLQVEDVSGIGPTGMMQTHLDYRCLEKKVDTFQIFHHGSDLIMLLEHLENGTGVKLSQIDVTAQEMPAPELLFHAVTGIVELEKLFINKKTNGIELVSLRGDIINEMIELGADTEMVYKIMERARKGDALTPEMEGALALYDVPRWYRDACKSLKTYSEKAMRISDLILALKLKYYREHYPKEYLKAYMQYACPSGSAYEKGIGHFRDMVQNMEYRRKYSLNPCGDDFEYNRYSAIMDMLSELEKRDILYDDLFRKKAC